MLSTYVDDPRSSTLVDRDYGLNRRTDSLASLFALADATGVAVTGPGNVVLWIRLLGPVTVVAHGRPMDVPGPRHRTLIALLALRAGETVTRDEIAAALWPSAPPRRAHRQVHGQIREVRGLLARAGCARTILTTEPTGYRLRLPPGSRDVDQLTTLVLLAQRERDAGRLDHARAALQSAYDLWQGRALGGVPADFALVAADDFERRRQAVLGDLVDVQLARAAVVV
jgi:DNA-binding winged helix-turn-helix (wHTH) protein